MAVMVALIRGFARHTMETIGNFWVDMTRSTVYMLLPLSVVLALALVSQGVVQNFSAYQTVTTVETITYDNSQDGCRRQPGERRCRQPGHREGDHQGTDHRPGTGRLARCDQAARHQRRRFLQRQLGSSLRESYAVREFPGDAGNVPDSCRAVLHLRQHGGRHAPGLGVPRRDDDIVRRLPRRGRIFRATWQPRLRCAGSGSNGFRHAIRRQHGRQGNALRHCQLRPVGHRHHRPPPTVR